MFANNDTVQLVNAIGVICTALFAMIGAAIAGYYGYKIKMKQFEIELSQRAAVIKVDAAAVKVNEVAASLTEHRIIAAVADAVTDAKMDSISEDMGCVKKQTNGLADLIRANDHKQGMQD